MRGLDIDLPAIFGAAAEMQVSPFSLSGHIHCISWIRLKAPQVIFGPTPVMAIVDQLQRNIAGRKGLKSQEDEVKMLLRIQPFKVPPLLTSECCQ
jgi:hypothetical protein